MDIDDLEQRLIKAEAELDNIRSIIKATWDAPLPVVQAAWAVLQPIIAPILQDKAVDLDADDPHAW